MCVCVCKRALLDNGNYNNKIVQRNVKYSESVFFSTAFAEKVSTAPKSRILIRTTFKRVFL